LLICILACNGEPRVGIAFNAPTGFVLGILRNNQERNWRANFIDCKALPTCGPFVVTRISRAWCGDEISGDESKSGDRFSVYGQTDKNRAFLFETCIDVLHGKITETCDTGVPYAGAKKRKIIGMNAFVI
jgi:hypothetical protein